MVKTALDVAQLLRRKKIFAEVINARFIKPFDESNILKSITKTKNVFTIEDGYTSGGLASKVQKLVANKAIYSSYYFGYPDEFIKQGETTQIEKKYKLDKYSIANKISETYYKNTNKQTKKDKNKNTTA